MFGRVFANPRLRRGLVTTGHVFILAGLSHAMHARMFSPNRMKPVPTLPPTAAPPAKPRPPVNRG